MRGCDVSCVYQQGLLLGAWKVFQRRSYNIDTSYPIIFQVFSRDCCIRAYEFFLASLEPSEDTESCSGTLSDAVSLSPLLAFLADTFFLLYALE